MIICSLILIFFSKNGHNHFPTFRVLGVLQRFAFCYLINASLEAIFTPSNDSEQVRHAEKYLREFLKENCIIILMYFFKIFNILEVLVMSIFF